MKRHEVTNAQWELIRLTPRMEGEDGASAVGPACNAQRHSLDSLHRRDLA